LHLVAPEHVQLNNVGKCFAVKVFNVGGYVVGA
jgi:hypothetical protein